MAKKIARAGEDRLSKSPTQVAGMVQNAMASLELSSAADDSEDHLEVESEAVEVEFDAGQRRLSAADNSPEGAALADLADAAAGIRKREAMPVFALRVPAEVKHLIEAEAKKVGIKPAALGAKILRAHAQQFKWTQASFDLGAALDKVGQDYKELAGRLERFEAMLAMTARATALTSKMLCMATGQPVPEDLEEVLESTLRAKVA